MCCGVLASAIAWSAPALAEAPRLDESPSFLARRDDHIHRQEALFGYLTGAAALSLAGGAALWIWDPPGFAGKPREYRTSFATLALVYGALNAAFVAASFAGLGPQRERLTNDAALDWDRRHQARIYAANAGLDMIYITLGFTLWATDKRPIVQGMGASLAVQGGLLFGLDGGGAAIMTR